MSFLQRLALWRADFVVPTSARAGEASSVVNAASPRTRPIPIGMPLDEITLVDPAREADWLSGRRLTERYGLFVGRLVSYKGLDVLLEAAARCDAQLVIVGRGTLQPWLEGEIRRLGLSRRVHMVSHFVPDDELKLYYKHADFLVLPSITKAEAFGMVQVEAMAFGKPVINTDLPTGVPTVSLDGVTGMTVPVGSVSALAHAMQRLWTDADLRRDLGEAARSRAWQAFHLDTMVCAYLDLLEEGIRRHSAPRMVPVTFRRGAPAKGTPQ